MSAAPGTAHGLPDATRAPTSPVVEIYVTEPLDTAAGVRLRGLLADAVNLRPEHLVVDVSACPFVGAVAVEALLDAHRHLWSTGGRLTLRSPSDRLRRILDAARVGHVVHISPAVPGSEPPVLPVEAATGNRRHGSPSGGWAH
jgi:anti-anti-sigma factor